MMMAKRWFAYCAPEEQKTLECALELLDTESELEFFADAFALRQRLHENSDICGVLIGLCSRGISDINAAAALLRDNPRLRVVLVREKSSGSLLSRAARAGIDQVLELSQLEHHILPCAGRTTETGGDGGRALQSGLAQQVLREGRHMTAPQELTAPEKHAAILCFYSARGGVGKSAIVASMASIAASWKMNVAVLDLDLAYGNVAGYLSIAKSSDLAKLENMPTLQEEELASLSSSSPAGVELFGPCDKPEEAEIVYSRLGELADVLKHNFDLVLVDMPAVLNEANAQLLQRADRVMLVSSTAAGSRSSVVRAQSLVLRLGVAQARVVQLINHADAYGEAELQISRKEESNLSSMCFSIFEDEGAQSLLAAGNISILAESTMAFAQSCAHALAHALLELGVLPECAEASRALELTGRRRKRVFPFFREAS